MLVTDHMTDGQQGCDANKKKGWHTQKMFLTTQFWTLLFTTTCKERLASLETSVRCSVAGKKAKTLLGSINEKW